MNEDKPSVMPPVPPFVRFVASAVPMVFDDSLSYYEALCALWKYVSGMTDVINNNATLEEEYIEKFNELKSFVDTYFDNLDVQEEINNKLDAMVEDGTLQEIISDYLNATAVWGFDTVADMKASTNLIDGSYARTLGYYAKNDGGASLYKITDTVDTSVHQEVLNSGLYATLIIESIADIRQFGVSTTNANNEPQLQEAINKCTNLVGFDGEINVANNITIEHTKFDYDFRNLTIKCTGSSIAQFITLQSPDSTRVKGSIKNLYVNSDAKAQIGLAVYDTRRLNIENVQFTGATVCELDVIGGKNASTANVTLNNIRCEKSANTPNTIALKLETSDNYVTNFSSVDYTKHIYNAGNNWFNMIHCWNWNNVIGSSMIETHSQSQFDNIYVDTIETGIDIVGSSAEQIAVNNITVFINPNAPDVTGCVPKPFKVNAGWISSGGRLKVTNGKFGNYGSSNNYLIVAPSYPTTNLHYFNLVNCYTGNYKVIRTWFDYYKESPDVTFTDYTVLTNPNKERLNLITDKGTLFYDIQLSGTLSVSANTNTAVCKINSDFYTAYGVNMIGYCYDGSTGKTYPIRWSINNQHEVRINVSSEVASITGSVSLYLSGLTVISSLPNE